MPGKQSVHWFALDVLLKDPGAHWTHCEEAKDVAPGDPYQPGRHPVPVH